MLKQLQKRMKRLVGRVHVQRAGPHRRFVGDDADHHALDPAEADDDVFREGAVDFQKFVGVDDAPDDAAHVHRALRIVRDEGADGGVLGERNVGARPVRRLLGIVLRQVGQQFFDDADGVGVVLREEMHIAGHGGVHVGAADLLQRHRLAGHRLDHLRPGDEHIGVGPGHDDEVHQRRRIGGAARAGAADHRDLRHHAGQQHVLVEHAAVARERVHALLDAGAGGILEGDDGRAEFRRLLHHRHDFLGVHLAQRTAEHGEILGEGRDHASVDIAGADHHAIGGQHFLLHAEMMGLMAHVAAHFLKGRLVEQGAEPVARRHQAFRAALGELFGAPAIEDILLAPPHILKEIGELSHSVTLLYWPPPPSEPSGAGRSGLVRV
jgi:hypothetical protein